MIDIWRNPEFVRHLRAQLRPPRAATAASLAVVICTLVGLLCWTSVRDDEEKFFSLFYQSLLVIQFVVAGFWCASACGQGISGEREKKTYDFLRATRLTSGELLVGKLFGQPIMTYYVLGCTLPISLVVGALADISLIVLVRTYALLVSLAVFLGLFGLLASMLTEKSVNSQVAGLFGLIPIGIGMAFVNGHFPGLAALSIIPAITSLYEAHEGSPYLSPPLFGIPASFPTLTVVLYGAFGAWIVVMLRRNIKRDVEEISLLSRWQALGFAAFLNLLFYAFLDARRLSADVPGLLVGLNIPVLYMIGLTTLTPHERLKVWWRQSALGQTSYLSDDGLPWPWMVLAAVLAYAFLVVGGVLFRNSLPIEGWQFGTWVGPLLSFLIFSMRDILFLQWCKLTAMKQPVAAGVLYLALYYAAASILVAVAGLGSLGAGHWVSSLLTPFGAFSTGSEWWSGLFEGAVGMALQMMVIGVLLNAIRRRLQQSAKVHQGTTAV